MSNGGYKGASPARETSPEQYPGVWELTEQFQAQADGNWPFQAADCAPKSLRFNGSNSYLTRTPAAEGSKTTWTWSAWVKRGSLGSFQYLFDCGSGSSPEEAPIRFWSDDRLNISAHTNTNIYNLTTAAKYRDTSAWMSIVVAFNSNESVANDRIKLYINGEQITEFDARSNPGLGTGYYINDNIRHDIGRGGTGNYRYFDGLMSEVHFIDGQALSCEEFGFFDGQGIWQPKRFTGDYSSGPVYSNFGSSSATLQNGNWGQVFDGSKYMYGGSGASNGPALANGSVSFSPVGLSGRVVKAGVRGGSNKTYTVNGSAMTFGSSSAEVAHIDLGSVQPITSIVGTSTDSSIWAQFYYIEVDGVVLTDASVGRNSFHLDFSDGVKDQSGLGNDWTPNGITLRGDGTIYSDSLTSTASFSANNPKTYGFDGSIAGPNVPYVGGSAAAIVWTPPGGYTYSEKIEMYVGGISGFRWNLNGGGWVNATVNSWNTVAVGSGTITTLSVDRNGSGTHGWHALKVDGQILIDGQYPDFFVDSPVNGNEASTGAGNERRGNYCCFNPSDKHSSLTISDGNLKVQASTTQWELARSTFFLSSGKYYWEFTWTGSVTSSSGYQMGLKTPESTLSAAAAQAGSYAFQYTTIYLTNGTQNSVVISPGSTTSGDTVMFAYDADAGKMWIGVNGTWNGSGNPSTGANPDWTDLPKTGLSPFAGCYGSSNTINLNAGQKAFEYTNHTGFSPLATSFLPEPAIKRLDEAMDVVVYEGNASVNKIKNLRMSPDLAWIKNYSNSTGYHHGWFDTVRGANKVIQSSTQANETTYTQQLTAFTDDGFELGNNSDSGNYVNLNGDDYYAWVWDAGDSTTTIAAGSLNSSVYDQTTTWSSLMSGHSQNAASAFDGNGTTYAEANSGATITIDLSTYSITATSRLQVLNDPAFTGSTDVVYKIYTTSSSTHAFSKTIGGTQSFNEASSNWGSAAITKITVRGLNEGARISKVIYDGKTLIDGNPGVGKTLTRFRAKTDWNWHRISAVKVNGTILTTGTLDNSGSVWTDPDEWKDGNANSSNATYSQSARGDWFDVTLASNIANFSELQFYMQLDSSSGSTTNVYEIELFFSDGTSFLRTYAANSDAPNQAGAAFNSWQWQNFGDLGVAVANVPSIATTVRARPEAGFSIAKYQGNGSTSGPSIAHNLGTEPAFVLIKNLDGSQSYPDWYVKHKDIGDNYNTRFNLTAGRELATGSGSWYQGGIGNLDSKYAINFVTGAQTSTGNVNTNGVNYIAYCWAEVEGLSRFGKYTARSAPHFIYCGFAPALVICKSITTGTSESWLMTTWKSQNQNSFGKYLSTNGSTYEQTTAGYMDLVSNGFVHRHNQGWNNDVANGYEYIFMAWATDPFASNNRAR